MRNQQSYDDIRKSLIDNALIEIETLKQFVCFLESDSIEAEKFMKNATEEMKTKEPEMYKKVMEIK